MNALEKSRGENFADNKGFLQAVLIRKTRSKHPGTGWFNIPAPPLVDCDPRRG
jgi:hypothetical protein